MPEVIAARHRLRVLVRLAHAIGHLAGGLRPLSAQARRERLRSVLGEIEVEVGACLPARAGDGVRDVRSESEKFRGDWPWVTSSCPKSSQRAIAFASLSAWRTQSVTSRAACGH